MISVKIQVDEVDTATLDTKRLQAGRGVLYPLTFSNNGQYLACFGGPKALIWKTADGDIAYELDSMTSELPTFSPRDTYLAACESEGVQLWRASKHEFVEFFAVPSDAGNVRSLFWGLDETRIYFLTTRCLWGWNINDARQNLVYEIPEGEEVIGAKETMQGLLVYSAEWTDGNLIRVLVTNALSGTRHLEISAASEGFPLLSPDGNVLLISIKGSRNRIQVWDVKANRYLGDFLYSGPHATSNTIKVGRQFCVVDSSRTIVWDTKSRDVLTSIEFQSEHYVKTSFAEAGGLIAATSIPADGTQGSTLFVDIMTGCAIGRASAHIGASLLFSPDGRWLASVADHNYLIDRPTAPFQCGTVFLTDLAPIQKRLAWGVSK